MGIFDKFKDFVGIEEIDEDDLGLDEDEVKSIIPESDPADLSKERPAERPARPAAPSRSESVRSEAPAARPTATARITSTGLKLVVTEPTGFEESPKLVDSLKARKPVIINLENLETDVARKIFDFLSGATYALNGNVQKVANNIFIFAPENVDVAYNMNQKAKDNENLKSPWKSNL